MKTALLCFLMLCGNHAAMANPNDDITDAETINVPEQLDEPQTDQVKPMVPLETAAALRTGHAESDADETHPNDQLKPVSFVDFDPFHMKWTQKGLDEMRTWFEQHALPWLQEQPGELEGLPPRERTKRELDPGITDVVQLLWDNGFETCDSGDGESKPLGPDVIPFPHVFMQVSLESFFPELLRLGEVLQREGVVCFDGRSDLVSAPPPPGHASVEGTFGVQWDGGRAPALHDGLIAVFGLDNEGLRLARERAGIEVTKSS